MPPNLAYPEFNKSFVVHTDTSGEGLETVLEPEQQDKLLHPVAITSQTLSKSERKNSIKELEVLGVVWGLKYFCRYLLGHKYVVYTDHTAVQSFFHSQRSSSSKLARWTEIVAEFDVEIQYRPGHKNANADALFIHQ